MMTIIFKNLLVKEGFFISKSFLLLKERQKL